MQDEVYEDEIEFDDPRIVDKIPSDELDNVAVLYIPSGIFFKFWFFYTNSSKECHTSTEY